MTQSHHLPIIHSFNHFNSECRSAFAFIETFSKEWHVAVIQGAPVSFYSRRQGDYLHKQSGSKPYHLLDCADWS